MKDLLTWLTAQSEHPQAGVVIEFLALYITVLGADRVERLVTMALKTARDIYGFVVNLIVVIFSLAIVLALLIFLHELADAWIWITLVIGIGLIVFRSVSRNHRFYLIWTSLREGQDRHSGFIKDENSEFVRLKLSIVAVTMAIVFVIWSTYFVLDPAFGQVFPSRWSNSREPVVVSTVVPTTLPTEVLMELPTPIPTYNPYP